MKLDTKLAVENSAEKMKISPNTPAWVLPLKDGFHKMIAYIRGEKTVWVHPCFKLREKKKSKK